MAFSRATLISRIRRRLGDNPFTEVISATASNVSSVTVADATKYDIGGIIEFQTDGAQSLITAASGTTLTVTKDYNGTTGSATTSTQIALDPVFQYIQITEAIDNAIQKLWPYVYKEVDETLTPVTTGNKWYDIATNSATLLELSQVNQVVGSGATSYIFFYGAPAYNGAYPAILKRDLPTAKVASGVGLYIPFLRDTTNSIFVVGIGKITDSFTTPNYDDLTDGLEVDCVMYYAIADLVEATDIPRITQQDISHGETTVRPGSRTSIGSVWEEKALRLRRQWQRDLEIRLPRLYQREV